jgi:hypothetical protein
LSRTQGLLPATRQSWLGMEVEIRRVASRLRTAVSGIGAESFSIGRSIHTASTVHSVHVSCDIMCVVSCCPYFLLQRPFMNDQSGPSNSNDHVHSCDEYEY